MKVNQALKRVVLKNKLENKVRIHKKWIASLTCIFKFIKGKVILQRSDNIFLIFQYNIVDV